MCYLVPAQVTGVDVKLQSSTDSITANVSWSPLTNIHGTITAYIVYYQPVNGFNSKQLRTSGNVSTILLRNLADKQNYEFKVHGLTSAGAGPNSTLVTRTGLPKSKSLSTFSKNQTTFWRRKATPPPPPHDIKFSPLSFIGYKPS